jgi:hypothetical protein
VNRDEVIKKLALILAGLQVPRSLDGPVMLGAAMAPYDELMHALRGFGWTNAAELVPELERVLA